jgi:hypothetical protein
MDIHDVERIFEIVSDRVKGLAGDLGEDLVFMEVRIPRMHALHKFTLGFDEVNHTESHDMNTVVQLFGGDNRRITEVIDEEGMLQAQEDAENCPIPLSIDVGL